MHRRSLFRNLLHGVVFSQVAPGKGDAPQLISDRKIVTTSRGPHLATRPFLVGIRMAHVDDPAFHELVGYYPDYTTNNSFMDPSSTRGESIAANNGYPVVIANSHYTPSYGYTAAGAAANSYLAVYLDGINRNLVPYASTIYAIRLDREWVNTEWEFSPYYSDSYTNPVVSPETWIAGWRNYVTMIRNIPSFVNVKIAWDYPCMADRRNALNPLSYYPGDDYVDIISCDIYFVREYYGGTSASCWDFYITHGAYNLDAWAAFADAHNKPMAVWEWGDNYGDGYCINKFGHWMRTHNVIAQSFWDEGGSYSKAPLQTTAANVAAFATQFGNTVYQGTHWPKIIPLPASKPGGF